MPKIEGTTTGVDYTLDNIDLRISRSLRQRGLVIVDGSELHLQADDVSFEMRDVKWSYQQYFPTSAGKAPLTASASEHSSRSLSPRDAGGASAEEEELDRDWYAA